MTDETPSQSADIRVVAGDPTPIELAALTAVLTGALEEIAGEHRRRRAKAPSAWERTRRGIRTPLVRGSWRSPGA